MSQQLDKDLPKKRLIVFGSHGIAVHELGGVPTGRTYRNINNNSNPVAFVTWRQQGTLYRSSDRFFVPTPQYNHTSTMLAAPNTNIVTNPTLAFYQKGATRRAFLTQNKTPDFQSSPKLMKWTIKHGSPLFLVLQLRRGEKVNYLTSHIHSQPAWKSIVDLLS